MSVSRKVGHCRQSRARATMKDPCRRAISSCPWSSKPGMRDEEASKAFQLGERSLPERGDKQILVSVSEGIRPHLHRALRRARSCAGNAGPSVVLARLRHNRCVPDPWEIGSRSGSVRIQRFPYGSAFGRPPRRPMLSVPVEGFDEMGIWKLYQSFKRV